MRYGFGLLAALSLCPLFIGSLPAPAAAQTACPAGSQPVVAYVYNDGLGRLTSQTVTCSTTTATTPPGGGGTQQAPMLPTWAMAAMAILLLGIGRSRLVGGRGGQSAASKTRV